jgi:hypothetical protein
MNETNWDAVEAVKTIAICTILDRYLPDWLNRPMEDSDKCINTFLKNSNAYYYARDNEYFSELEAKRLAWEAGKTLVVLDNLS